MRKTSKSLQGVFRVCEEVFAQFKFAPATLADARLSRRSPFFTEPGGYVTNDLERNLVSQFRIRGLLFRRRHSVTLEQVWGALQEEHFWKIQHVLDMLHFLFVHMTKRLNLMPAQKSRSKLGFIHTGN